MRDHNALLVLAVIGWTYILIQARKPVAALWHRVTTRRPAVRPNPSPDGRRSFDNPNRLEWEWPDERN